MSGALSKRQQARNERTLQDLIKSVPGNNVCADCQARNPGWASWSLGVFLCMRCAALHRKLGTHITKVKSLSMDSWSNEQVENMKKVGNMVSNRIYNPQNTRPPIPFDADEADSAMERFIRQKYQDRAVKAPARHNTGSTNSDDQPPPLPPKEGRRFGFRSASSIFPLSSKARRETAARQEFETSQQDDFDAFGERSPTHRITKQSRIFGNNVGSTYDDDLDMKMAKLRDMGFMDEKRNIAVLKGLSGNLEKSIETLTRLGEGNGVPRMPPKPKPTVDTSGPSSRSRTPLSPTAGLTIDRTPHKEPTRQTSNPFDMLDTPPPIAQPQSSQSTGSIPPPPNQNPYQQTNPFGLMPSQSQVGLNQAFQSMALSSPQPPLFPNHTGGFPSPQQQPNQQMYQQAMTPPVPSIPQQYYPAIYENVQQQPQQPQQVEQSINYNPFLQQRTQPQQVPPINTNLQSNPFMQQMQPQGQNLYQSPVEQQSPQQYRSPAAFHSYQNQPQPQSNPFLQNSQPQQSYDYQQQNQQQNQFQQLPRQQTFPAMAQQPGRADSRTILDLYNYPQVAPTPQQPQQQPQQPQQTQQDQIQAQNMAMPSTAAYQQQPPLPRSVSNPLATQIAGNRNPFMANGGAVHSPAGNSIGNMNPFPQVPNGARHASQESVNIDAGGWQNGRHSPDAWGTISARSAR
ncbi:UBA domain-containing protein [Lachnellula occidentalis]|uniref:UBA domain-containing protein n=1 Tax=Lachnellula occidentalis TaxID=215460 RepID=A0A8H8U404_9HELO|nr:UBA domain-containing protein [Lachnellula occidentalis]